jgi:serine/threonine protein kinase
MLRCGAMHPGAIVGGKYRLDRFIGEGAMGAVWAAVHLETHQPVAVKVVAGPEGLADELCSRLVREARACSLIRHPNVISVVDVGQLDDGAPFMVMQLLSGETLDVRLKRDVRLSPVEAARIGAQVARALCAAHAAGIVHRDLKPANIFLHVDHGASQSVVKVLDFGVSKILSERSGGGPDARATATGHAMGSPAYMSPEQAKSANKVDARADIWSLGVVLYEMFAGALPFPGETAYAVIGEVLHGTIPKLRDAVPKLDARLSDLVARCIVRDVGARIQSVEEAARILEGFLRDQAASQRLDSEKTEPLGSNRLRAAVLGSMRLGAAPDLDAPAVPDAAPSKPAPRTDPAPLSAPAYREPMASIPDDAGSHSVVTGAHNARPAANGSAAALESFARAPTARAFPQLAIAPPAAVPPQTVLMTSSPAASLGAGSPPVRPIPAAPPSNPQLLGARSSTAPILLAPQGPSARGALLRVPPSSRRWIGIGAAIGVTIVSLAVAILVLLGGGRSAGSGSGVATAATGASPTTPASTASADPPAPTATVEPTSPTTAEPVAAPTQAPAASAVPSSPPTTSATVKPAPTSTTSGKRPGKGRPTRPGTSFPTNPG